MDAKSKIIIIILVLISAGAGFYAYQQKQTYDLEVQRHSHDMENARKDREDLVSGLKRAQAEKKSVRKKLASIERELNDMLSERDNWRNKYEVILEEKNGLMGRLEELKRQNEKIKTKIYASAAAPASPAPAPAPAYNQQLPPEKGDAYWANVLRDKARISIQAEGLKQQLEQLHIKIEQLTKDNNDLNAELNRFNQIKADLKRQIVYNEKVSRTLSEELVREKNDKKVFKEQLDKVKQDYMVMQQQLKLATDESLSLSKQAQALTQEKQILARRISEMDQALQDRMSEIIEMKDQWTEIRSQSSARDDAGNKSRVVALPAIVVKSDDNGVSLKDKINLSGTVLAVNKENNFVVIDLGESSQIKAGEAFDVYRRGAVLGSIKIIQVRRDISAADIIYLKQGKEIRVGDKVSTK